MMIVHITLSIKLKNNNFSKNLQELLNTLFIIKNFYIHESKEIKKNLH